MNFLHRRQTHVARALVINDLTGRILGRALLGGLRRSSVRFRRHGGALTFWFRLGGRLIRGMDRRRSLLLLDGVCRMLHHSALLRMKSGETLRWCRLLHAAIETTESLLIRRRLHHVLTLLWHRAWLTASLHLTMGYIHLGWSLQGGSWYCRFDLLRRTTTNHRAIRRSTRGARKAGLECLWLLLRLLLIRLRLLVEVGEASLLRGLGLNRLVLSRRLLLELRLRLLVKVSCEASLMNIRGLLILSHSLLLELSLRLLIGAYWEPSLLGWRRLRRAEFGKICLELRLLLLGLVIEVGLKRLLILIASSKRVPATTVVYSLLLLLLLRRLRLRRTAAVITKIGLERLLILIASAKRVPAAAAAAAARRLGRGGRRRRRKAPEQVRFRLFLLGRNLRDGGLSVLLLLLPPLLRRCGAATAASVAAPVPQLVLVLAVDPAPQVPLIGIALGRAHPFRLRVVPGQVHRVDLVVVGPLHHFGFFGGETRVPDALHALIELPVYPRAGDANEAPDGQVDAAR